MNHLRHVRLASSVLLVSLCSGAGCSSSSSTGSPPSLAVTPATAKVLTCSSLAFTATGGVGGGSWSVATDGTIDKSGKYTAPTKITVDTFTNPAATEPATITYAEGSASATASIQLATAFVGAPVAVPTGTNTHAKENVPFEHTFTANGTRVYAVVNGATPPGGEGPLSAEIYRSDDGGKTFTGPVSYSTGKILCVTAAVDAVNPDVLYMAYYAGHGDSTANTGDTLRLAVSTDGGKTFPTEYVVADSDNSIVDLICPDVASPSGDHVIVTGGVEVPDVGVYAGAFISGNRGKDIGPIGVKGVLTPPNPATPTDVYAKSVHNGDTVHSDCSIDDNGNGQSPRVFANGSGTACMVYVWVGDGCPKNGGSVVQCSTDNGATWTAPFAFAVPKGARTIPTGAISSGGNVAVTWVDAVGDRDEVFVASSKDKGATFGAPIAYPSAARQAFRPYYTGTPTVRWESDSILWLSQTLNGSDDASVVLDKTCDFGVTWSGGIEIGLEGYGDGSYRNLGMAQVSGGMLQFSSKADQLLSFSLAP